MVEAKLAWRVVLSMIGLCLLCEAGCGSSSSAASEESSSSTGDSSNGKQGVLAARKELLRETVGKLDDRDEACKFVSDHFLTENYGAPGRAGRHRCERVAAKLRPKGIRSYRILEFRPRQAKVRVIDTSGDVITAAYVFARDRWLLDDIRSPDTDG
jgi:hypothetical protein